MRYIYNGSQTSTAPEAQTNLVIENTADIKGPESLYWFIILSAARLLGNQ